MKRAYHEGGITKRLSKEGKLLGYQVQMRAPGGKRVTLGTVRTMREAKTLAQRGIVDMHAGRLVTNKRQTLAQYLSAWLENLRPSIREKTFVSYETCVSRVIHFLGDTRLDQLKPAQVQQCYSDLLASGTQGKPLSLRSVEQTHTVLHGALRQAVNLELIGRNPVDVVTSPRPHRREMQTLTAAQCAQLFETTKEDWLGALWVVLITAGPRIGEALGMQWKDVDLTSRSVEIRRALQRQRRKGLVFVEPKSVSSRRVLELTQLAVDALHGHRQRQLERRLLLGPAWQDTGMVFCSDIGTPLDPRNALRRLQRTLDSQGLPPIRLHDLRHTAATLQLQQGTHPRAVQAMLGHVSWALTMNTYSHVAPMMQREAADRMDALFARTDGAAGR
jgi:integrase